MEKIKQALTIETRLPSSLDGVSRCALDAYADQFSRATRHYHRDSQKDNAVNKPAFMRAHGLTGRQFNAVKVSVQGMEQSRLSNLPNYVAQYQQKIMGLTRRLKKNTTHATYFDSINNPGKAAKYWRTLPGFRQRIQRLTHQKSVLEQQIKEKSATICFGSKKLFRQQFNLKENGYTHHSQWLKDWRDARRQQFFVLGSSDEAGGCQGCTLLPDGKGEWILRLRLPPALEDEFGQYLYLDGLHFSYQGHLLETAIAEQQLRKEKVVEYRQAKKAGTLPLKDDGTPITEATFVGDLGQALSYRFIRDAKGWRVLVSTRARFEPATMTTDNGAIGVDFNAGFVSVAELNARGSKVSVEDIPYAKLNATSAQNKTAMQALAIRIVKQAKESGKPIVIESLDFKRKKAGLQKRQQGEAGYHRMISALSYSAFRQALTMQCLKQQVALIPVNPAYTSLIGRLKYARETHFNTHQAAAWVIARRGMGLKERVALLSPVHVLSRLNTYRAPADAREDTFQSLKLLSADFSAWFTRELKAQRRRRELRRVSWDLQDVPI